MQTTVTKTIALLNKLLRMNNNRIEVYRKASADIQELDLKTLLQSMGDDSRKNVAELNHEIKKLGGVSAGSETTLVGRLFRIWLSVKAAFTGKDRHSILDTCEFGEDVIQHGYRDVIASNDLSTDIRQFIRNQQISLRISHDMIRNYRERSHYGYAGSY